MPPQVQVLSMEDDDFNDTDDERVSTALSTAPDWSHSAAVVVCVDTDCMELTMVL